MEFPQLHQQPHEQHNLLRLQNLIRTNKKQHRLKIDVSKTEYPLIRNIAHAELGWRVWSREDSKEEVNLFWIDTYVHDQFVRKMKPYQRVNHIPGSQNLGKKNQLSSNISKMKKLLPKQYSFYPNTFNFPADLQEYQKFAKKNQHSYYIVKPCSDSQGRGIYLTKEPDTTSKEEVVVQEYIEQPLLIEKNKFDLRIYVLLKSICPLKIYVYEEGLCRLATSEYQKPQSSNKKNMNMHLTNYAINKLSPNYIFNKSEYEDSVGHKRSLSATFKILQKMGYDTNTLKLQIDKIIVKTILAVQPLLVKKYKQVRDNRQQSQNTCFEILGFDILVKQDGQPILLQVNHSPSFCTQTPLDFLIKKNLILDTLNLLNFNFDDKINYIKSRNEQDYISNNQVFRNYAKNVVINAQPVPIGGYRKIFPIDSPQHLQLSKLYQNIIKVSKNEKPLRVGPPKYMPESYLHKTHLNLNQDLDIQVKAEIDDIIFKNHSLTNNRSLSLYHVINNLKRTKLHQLKSVIQYDQLCAPISFIPEHAKKLEPTQQQTNYSNPQQKSDLIKKEELALYQKNIKRNFFQFQKKKYIRPLPIANVNIRLDQKYSHRVKQDKNTNRTNDNQGSFKIHSFFNTTYLGGRRKVHQEGHRTANNGSRDNKSMQDALRKPQKTNRLNSYSVELKQKIERMQLARIRIQKRKKLQKTSFMLIKSQVPEQKMLNEAIFNQAQ